METKMIKVPFDVELAKKITNGECEGRIVTSDGRNVRIVCWDALRADNLVVLIPEGTIEKTYNYTPDGKVFINDKSPLDLILEVPKPIEFKDGDIVSLRNGDIAIIKGEPFKNVSGNLTLSKTYIRLSGNTLGSLLPIILDDAKEATEDEINKLKYKMQDYNDSYVKSLCKRFFQNHSNSKNIGKDYKFKPFDKVLGRECETDKWRADLFSHMNEEGEFICIGYVWDQCIPYNEQTAHLLGTTENYE